MLFGARQRGVKSNPSGWWIIQFCIVLVMHELLLYRTKNPQPSCNLEESHVKLSCWDGQTSTTGWGDPTYWTEESFCFRRASFKLICPPTMPVMLWKQQFPVWISQNKKACWVHLSAHQSNLVPCTATSISTTHVTQLIRFSTATQVLNATLPCRS